MLLSPEERRRIYLEEQARLEAIEELSEGKKSKKAGCFIGVLLIAFLLFVGYIANQNPTEGTRPNPLKLLDLDFHWHKAGFENVMMGDFTIHNKNAFDVKDVEITCTHLARAVRA